jgi:hypothetical protein
VPSARVLEAVRALGLLGADDAAEPVVDAVRGEPGARRTDLPPPAARGEPAIFGLEVAARE